MFEKLKHMVADLNLRTKKVYDLFSFQDQRVSKAIRMAVFFISVFFIYWFVGIFKHIHERPAYIHISAQCQRASIALNYYKTDMNFFKPRIQRYIKGEGITGVEFPIIYYMPKFEHWGGLM